MISSRHSSLVSILLQHHLLAPLPPLPLFPLLLILQRTLLLILQWTLVLILHWLQPRAPTIATTTTTKTTQAMKMTFSLGSQELPLWCRRHRRVPLLLPLRVLLLILQRTLVLPSILQRIHLHGQLLLHLLYRHRHRQNTPLQYPLLYPLWFHLQHSLRYPLPIRTVRLPL